MDLDFESICRTCLKTNENMVPIMPGKAEKVLKDYFQLQIHNDDGLPQHICQTCLREVNKIVRFEQRSRTSEETLRKIHKDRIKIKIEIKPEIKVEEDENFENFCTEEPQTDPPIPYQCNECHEVFKWRQSIFRHFSHKRCSKYEFLEKNKQRRHTYECNACCEKFSGKRKLMFHFTRRQCRKYKFLPKRTKQGQNVKVKRFKCQICNKFSTSASALRRHFIHHAKKIFVKENCIEEITRSSAVEKSEYGSFKCIACEKNFPSEKEIGRHFLTFHKAKLQCEICDKIFDQTPDFNLHFVLEHKGMEEQKAMQTDQKIFPCTVCNKEFKARYNLSVHLNIHYNKRPHLCQTCGMGFNALSGLRSHEVRHQSVKPFKCKICPKDYYKEGDLKNHMRSHTGERPYRCEDCGKGYTHQSSLIIHRGIHTGEPGRFACKYCPKRFRRQGHFEAHERIHTGERPYACKICSQRFTQKYDMVKHFRRHPESQDYTDP